MEGKILKSIKQSRSGFVSVGLVLSAALGTLGLATNVQEMVLTQEQTQNITNKVKHLQTLADELRTRRTNNEIMRQAYLLRSNELVNAARMLARSGAMFAWRQGAAQERATMQQIDSTIALGSYNITRHEISFDDLFSLGQTANSYRTRNEVPDEDKYFSRELGSAGIINNTILYQVALRDVLKNKFAERYREYLNKGVQNPIPAAFAQANLDVQKIIDRMPEKTRNSSAFQNAYRASDVGERIKTQNATLPPSAPPTPTEPSVTTTPPRKTAQDCQNEYNACADNGELIIKQYFKLQKELVNAGKDIDAEPYRSELDRLWRRKDSLGCIDTYIACCKETGVKNPSRNRNNCAAQRE